MLPRLKSFEYFSRDGSFVACPDVGVELHIHDPDGQVERLCALIDGRRGAEAIHVEMQARWPELTLADIVEGLEGLGDAGIIEDATAVSRDSGSAPGRY